MVVSDGILFIKQDISLDILHPPTTLSLTKIQQYESNLPYSFHLPDELTSKQVQPRIASNRILCASWVIIRSAFLSPLTVTGHDKVLNLF